MILILSGLPASGKSTYAKQWVDEEPEQRVRINYDDLRSTFSTWHGGQWLPFKWENEKEVKREAARIAALAINSGKDIIIDNTNLTPNARAVWEELGRHYGVKVEHEDIEVPIPTIIERDLKRPERVGRAVIERMALTTGWIDWSDEDQYDSLERFVIVDVDGTLSNASHRLHHLEHGWICNKCGEKLITLVHVGADQNCLNGYTHINCGGTLDSSTKNWDKFFADAKDDAPQSTIVELAHLLAIRYSLLIVSGRPIDKCGIATEDWLMKHLGPRVRHLFMRRGGDKRPDDIVKEEILDYLPKDKIAFVLDDRDRVVEMWRKNGLTCLQVAPGNF